MSTERGTARTWVWSDDGGRVLVTDALVRVLDATQTVGAADIAAALGHD